MSSDNIAIKVTNLSKCYQIYDSPHDRLKQFVMPRLRRVVKTSQKQYFHEFWALNDVSFEIKKGETVGIIGCNGSGKSTLLQVICGTLSPTDGVVETNGRIAALLELGSGFNPEFTGRENIQMNASILGLSNKEIEERFDDITDFADIGDFIEQPVKTYSSGMVVRLAFAVAINVDPEILIIDEALSVGDELFQRKCFSRIEAIKNNGATILFVSHSGHTIVELCDRAILMDAGDKLSIGSPKIIVGNYQNLLYAPADKQNEIREKIRASNELINTTTKGVKDTSHKGQALTEYDNELLESFDPNLKSSSTIEYESRGALIESPKVLTLDGEQVNNIIRGKTYCYTYTVNFTKSSSNVQFGMAIKTTSGIILGGTRSNTSDQKELSYIKSGTCYRISFYFRCTLNQGTYYLNAGVANLEGFLHRMVDVAVFRVIPDSIGFSTGTVDFSGNFELKLMETIDSEQPSD